MTRLGLGLGFLALVLVACTADNPEPVGGEATSTVSAFDIEFDHPADLVLRAETDEQAEYCFESELDLRHTRCLRFERNGEPIDDTEYQELGLTSDGTFSYVADSVDEGSGGTEHSLSGYIELDSATIFVVANASEEAGFSDATWALPLIQTVRR